jgi:hypothetical protein
MKIFYFLLILSIVLAATSRSLLRSKYKARVKGGCGVASILTNVATPELDEKTPSDKVYNLHMIVGFDVINNLILEL